MAEPTYRMSMLPFGTYPNENGQGEHLGLAVPGMIQEPVNALMRLFGSGNFAQGPDYPGNADDMRTLLFSMYGGNAMNPAAVIPKGSLASNAFKAAERLPMDEASRLARAREMGFDTDNVLYHGTSEPFSEFSNFHIGSANDAGALGSGHYFTDAPRIANWYAQDFNGSNVIPAYVNNENLFSVTGSGIDHGFARGANKTVDLLNAFAERHPDLLPKNFNPREYAADLSEHHNSGAGDDIAALLQGAGYSGVDYAFPSGGREVAMFNPEDIRSKFAAFNPADIDKAGLLLSDTGKPSLFGSAVAGAEANKPMRAYRGYGGRSEDEAFLYPERDMLFASSDPHTAATYANSAPNGDPVLSRYGISTQGAVAPLEMNFENPLRVDAQGSVWDQIPFNGKSWSTTDEIANLARERGHDGLILDNVRDGIGTAGNYLPPASTYVALKRGTVTSPLTGETLFSDGLPSIWGNALAPYQDEPRNALLNY